MNNQCNCENNNENVYTTITSVTSDNSTISNMKNYRNNMNLEDGNRSKMNNVTFRLPNSSNRNTHERETPSKSTDKEKTKLTKGYLATVSALAYLMFLVIFGTILFMADAVENQHPIPEIFCIYMICIGFAYFLFLYIDIRRHVHRTKEIIEERARRQSMFQESLSTISGDQNTDQFNIQLPELSRKPVNHFLHTYCFVTGRHGELLYLKMGAAFFCFGLLIHSLLIITYQIIFLTSTNPDFLACASYVSVILEFLFPLYSLFLLFFVFKYANIIINEYRALARMALMHSIGTSLAFWMHTIIRETKVAIRLKNDNKKGDDIDDILDMNPFLLECEGPNTLNTIYRNFSPYLYPFVIEYSILMVGIFYMIYANINKCPRRKEAKRIYKSNQQESSTNNSTSESNEMDENEIADHFKELSEHDGHFNNSLIVYADCHAANKGLFSGLILLVLTIVFVILFFVAAGNEEFVEIGIKMNSAFECVVLLGMTIAVLLAYFKTTTLDVNSLPVLCLDDILLYISLPAFFMDTIFSMIPAYKNGSILNICRIIAQLVQVLIQTPWIMDGLRRCSNKRKYRRVKPGREIVTFTICANVALWVFYTFSVKTIYVEDERYEFYGDILWTILSHLSLPLIMFYRFHSSVCLVDIWRHAYEPGEMSH